MDLSMQLIEFLALHADERAIDAPPGIDAVEALHEGHFLARRFQLCRDLDLLGRLPSDLPGKRHFGA
jgi:hypothetical protein